MRLPCQKKPHLDIDVEANFTKRSKYLDTKDEVTYSENKSYNNKEVEVNSLKFTNHTDSKDKVTLSKQKDVCETEFLSATSL